MYDKQLIIEILSQLYESTQVIRKRFSVIKSVSDFEKNDVGMEKRDAICMQLIAVGEGIKNLDKATNHKLLEKYPQIDWKKVKGMRDIITHHYFDIDTEVVYGVCENHIELLGETLKKIINDVKGSK